MSLGFDFGELNPEFIEDLAEIDGTKARMAYKGPERRIAERRNNENRRNQLRFEPGKCIDRREVTDRRAVIH